jgi:hypothetical protein
MSSELVAALVGAIAGGIIALFGGIAQVFIQGWISDRGQITYDIVAWEELTFRYYVRTGSGPYFDPVSEPWEEARAYYLSRSPADLPSDDEIARYFHDQRELYVSFSASISFTVNFLNTKGTNAALLEYSIQFLKGNQTVMKFTPSVRTGSGFLLQGQAVSLAAEDVTAIHMESRLSTEAVEKVMREADSLQFTGRLSTGQDIKVELDRLSQNSKRTQKGDAV